MSIPSQSPIKVVIADDHDLYREGFIHVITKKSKGTISIVGEASNGSELLSVIAEVQPNIVVSDIMMPVMDGIQACEIISQRFPNTKVIALSQLNEPHVIYDMFEAGAKGYLTKSRIHTEIIEAVHTVSVGDMHYSSDTSSCLIKMIGSGKHNPFQKNHALSFCDLEINIIKLIAKQQCNKQIADQLHISLRTVDDYNRRLKDKIGAINLVGVALYGVKHGIVSLSDI